MKTKALLFLVSLVVVSLSSPGQDLIYDHDQQLIASLTHDTSGNYVVKDANNGEVGRYIRQSKGIYFVYDATNVQLGEVDKQNDSTYIAYNMKKEEIGQVGKLAPTVKLYFLDLKPNFYKPDR